MAFSPSSSLLFPVARPETFVCNSLFLLRLFLILGVFFSVLIGLVFCLFDNSYRPYLLEGHTLEAAWTRGPMLLIFLLALPTLLHNLSSSPSLFFSSTSFSRFFALGHQWYWEYRIIGVSLDRYTYRKGIARLFSVDSHFLWPCMVPLRLIVRAADVIHNFNVPSFSLSMDAVPGRIRTKTLIPLCCGLFFGLCSEVCGPGHYSIAIAVELLSPSAFIAIFN